VLAVCVAVVGWGFNNVIVKITSVPGLTFTFWRLWLGAGAMMVVLTLARRRLTRDVLVASAPGGLLLGVEMIFFFLALKQTSVADVTIIAALQPALTLLVAGPMFGEVVTGAEIAWTSLSLGGVALVAIGSSGTPAWSLRGDALAAVSLLAWTAYFVVTKRVRARIPTLEYLTAVMIVAALLATPVALLSRDPLLASMHASDWFWLGLFVVGGTSGHVLLTWAQPRVPVKVSSLLMLGLPVVSGIAALLVLGETLAPLEIVGGLVVIGAVAAVVVRAARSGAGEEIETDVPG
jgi:drug/metabolite transporter (DMT)-like permease